MLRFDTFLKEEEQRMLEASKRASDLTKRRIDKVRPPLSSASPVRLCAPPLSFAALGLVRRAAYRSLCRSPSRPPVCRRPLEQLPAPTPLPFPLSPP